MPIRDRYHIASFWTLSKERLFLSYWMKGSTERRWSMQQWTEVSSFVNFTLAAESPYTFLIRMPVQSFSIEEGSSAAAAHCSPTYRLSHESWWRVLFPFNVHIRWGTPTSRHCIDRSYAAWTEGKKRLDDTIFIVPVWATYIKLCISHSVHSILTQTQ